MQLIGLNDFILQFFHTAVLDFDPGVNAVWREGGIWRPGLVIGHNDAAPYNAVWNTDGLVGFFDWDLAGPLEQDSDLAWMAFSWIPLHARDVVEAEGFTNFDDRRRRLELFLQEYGSELTVNQLLDILRLRILEIINSMRLTAASGDLSYQKMLELGLDQRLLPARAGLDEI